MNSGAVPHSIRDVAVSTICSNLAWCGLLLPTDLARYIGYLFEQPDSELLLTLLESRNQLEDYLATSSITDRVVRWPALGDTKRMC